MKPALPTLLYLGLVAIDAAFPLHAQERGDSPAAKMTLEVEVDYLALHASGTAPPDTQSLEHRLTLSGESAQPGPWTAAPLPGPGGRFKFDVPLPEWRWARLELRAVMNGQTLTAQRAVPLERALTMLTPERIAALPETQRAVWQNYIGTSLRNAAHERDILAGECRQLGMPASQPAPGSNKEFEFDSNLPPAWYGGAEAVQLAAAVLSYQTPSGGWSKGIDYRNGPRQPGTHWTNNAANPWHYCGTLDNRSTTEQIEFLARVHVAAGNDTARTAVLRGLKWLLTAQFPNGGWPQNYPVERGYHEAITLNDGAMLHALELLLSASEGRAPFTFLDATLRQQAGEAVARALTCLLEAQVNVDGKPTIWCAQHDPLSVLPVAARPKEPPSLSGAESADLLRFLMRRGPTYPAMIHAIHTGVEWLASHPIRGLKTTKAAGKTDYVIEPASTEVYWARFYDVSTNLPIFAGAQDGIIYSSFHEMAEKNVVAYDYFTTRPGDVINKEWERWIKRVQKTSK